MLKLNFVSKIPKLDVKNELIFINNKNFKHKSLNRREIFKNEIFKEKKIIQRNYQKDNYIFINCIDQKKSLDFENIGSKFFDCNRSMSCCLSSLGIANVCPSYIC